MRQTAIQTLGQTRLREASGVSLSNNNGQSAPPVTAGSFDASTVMQALSGKNVLIVEDEILVAMDIGYALEDVGATPVGPAPTLKSAMSIVSTGVKIDAAILDINLSGEDAFPAAAILHQRGVPFLFHTGHGACTNIETMFPGVPFYTKPMKMERLLDAVATLVIKQDA